MKFKLQAPFQLTGDQPQAVEALTSGVKQGRAHQTLLGVTGSGKTFTVANVIERTQKPTLVISHNKTLAAQLYQEFKEFFPNNAVSYFVSYYDYYQPEAYIPSSDTYIEKEATINDEIDKLRLATTTNLLTRPDVIVVASVSCIYNLGSPVEYGRYMLELIEGQLIDRSTLLLKLTDMQYERSDHELKRGTYRLRGDLLQIWPAYEDLALNIDTLENKITTINWIDPISGNKLEPAKLNGTKFHLSASSGLKRLVLYPAKHYLVNPKSQDQAFAEIKRDLDNRLEFFKRNNKLVEAYRLKQKVEYDLEMIREFGFVNGIENYSLYFDGRQTGAPPFTLFDYFQANVKQFDSGSFLTVIDESHMSLPQIRGMFNGDQARKQTLIDYGFRLPTAKDNRPLRFPEFQQRAGQTIYVSATPNQYELSLSQDQVVEQLVRPTGLVDPEVDIRPIDHQIDNLILEIIKRKAQGQRVLVTTLTKKMAEALTDYLNDQEKVLQLLTNSEGKTDYQRSVQLPKVAYLHSDIETLKRSQILSELREGKFDVLVGINLLREGLDLPEVSLVAILDADKQGFLRSATALIQTMGRAARHSQGLAIMYADQVTDSMRAAINETSRRRLVQLEYNTVHHLTPTSISKPIRDKMIDQTKDQAEDQISDEQTPGLIIHLNKKESIDLGLLDPESLTPQERLNLISKLTKKMKQAADQLDFELATILRDKISALKP